MQLGCFMQERPECKVCLRNDHFRLFDTMPELIYRLIPNNNRVPCKKCGVNGIENGHGILWNWLNVKKPPGINDEIRVSDIFDNGSFYRNRSNNS